MIVDINGMKVGVLPGIENIVSEHIENQNKAKILAKYNENVSRLKVFFKTEHESWIEQYRIFREIKDYDLFKNDNIKSFSAWVKKFSNSEKVHESYIWRIFKAGEILDKYYARDVNSLVKKCISAETICLVERVGRGNDNLIKSLLKKIISGKIQKKDLKKMLLDQKVNRNVENK